MDEKGLGVRLQEARKHAGLTQQELCQKSGLSYSTLAKIERGAIKSPSIFTIQQIAASLGTTVDELVGSAVSHVPSSQKKRSKSGVTFVYFDINGCLVRFFQRAFSSIAAETGATSNVVESTYLRYNSDVCKGSMSLDEFNRKLAEAFEVETFDWSPYYLDAIDGMSESAELVKWVSSHYRVGLLSNIMPGLITSMRTKGLIPDIAYDSIIDSSVVKAIKPEREIYDIAQAKASCPPEEILFIDDTLTNLKAAEELGWQVLHFDDFFPAASAERIKGALEF